jgi:hypothetical protein
MQIVLQRLYRQNVIRPKMQEVENKKLQKPHRRKRKAENIYCSIGNMRK